MHNSATKRDEIAASLVGKTIAEAEAICAPLGFWVDETRLTPSGHLEILPVNSPERISVGVFKGRIVKVVGG